jgi:hypothetical protein
MRLPAILTFGTILLASCSAYADGSVRVCATEDGLETGDGKITLPANTIFQDVGPLKGDLRDPDESNISVMEGKAAFVISQSVILTKKQPCSSVPASMLVSNLYGYQDAIASTSSHRLWMMLRVLGCPVGKENQPGKVGQLADEYGVTATILNDLTANVSISDDQAKAIDPELYKPPYPDLEATDHEQERIAALDPANIVIAPPVKLCRSPASLAEYAKAMTSKDLQWAESVPGCFTADKGVKAVVLSVLTNAIAKIRVIMPPLRFRGMASDELYIFTWHLVDRSVVPIDLMMDPVADGYRAQEQRQRLNIPQCPTVQ